MKFLIRLATVLAIIAVPLSLIGIAVRVLFSYQPLYEYGFDRYRVADYTGIDRADLTRVAQALVVYFNNEQREVNLEIRQRGERRPVFTEREVLHMVDVKGLVRTVNRIGDIALAGLILFAAVVFWRDRARAPTRVGSVLRTGSVLTLLLLVALAGLSFADFDQLFLRFHELSFQANDYWLLDPRIHNLIAMFPAPFWLLSTLLLAGLIAVQALLVFLIGWQVSRLTPRGAKVAA